MVLQKIAATAALALLSSAALADGWTFAPMLTDPSFKLEPTLALSAGAVKLKNMDSMSTVGLEFNFNCGLLQSPDKRMRTHLSVSKVDDNGFKATDIELSPRYTVPLGNGLSAGVGPSLGLVAVKAGSDEKLFSYGLAGGVNFRSGAFYAGADLRMQNTSTKNNVNYDSWAMNAKVGMNF